MDNKIGAQYYTIRDYCKTLEDFDASCKRISQIGYKNVQLSGIGDFKGKDLKKILDKYGLTCVCTHRTPNNYLENIEAEIEFHKALNCNICGIGAMPGFNCKRDNIDSFIKNFKPVCEALNKHGLVFAYHNHALEFEKSDGKFVFDVIADGLACENFKYILDVYWLSVAGINPVKFIKERKGKIACVHFKDLKIVENKAHFAEVGEGNLNWDEIIEACKQSDVEFALVEQDKCDGDPFDSLQKSYNYLIKKGFN